MFKIVQRGSEHGSDQEQPHPSKRLQGSTQQGSDSVKKDSGHEGQKLTSNEQIKKSSPQTPSSVLGSPKMEASIQLIDDELELLDSIKEFICDGNKRYTVVGAIGSQGMLAGNDTMDMYRQYIFRPCAREAVESCRYQTTKISIYIAPKTRVFFLDCQPLNCAPLLEDTSHSYRSKAGPMESLELESLQFLLLLANVCHTVFLCVDWFIDMSIIRRLMRVELFPQFLNVSESVNLVILHQRVRQQDCHPLLVNERMRLLNGIFAGTIFNVNGGLTLANLGFDVYQQIESNVNYILMEEIKPRTRTEIYSPDTFSQKTNSLEYATVLNRLRIKLHSLPKRELAMTEGKWFSYLVECWSKIKLELLSITEDGCTIKTNYLKAQFDSVGLASDRNFSTEDREIGNDDVIERYLAVEYQYNKIPIKSSQHQQRERQWKNRVFEKTRSSRQNYNVQD
ncbi:unnamed protein product [Meloidogyne enterolobii]|uniref:Uncharacterized protein n=1 Tax=Meloidogyne enterolobii TaxID=390850 RepID=A0ACB0Z923_MELEN